MKIRFKHQAFQEQAANSVCDVFRGQPRLAHSYQIDPGMRPGLMDNLGWNNQPLRISDAEILANLNRVQLENGIPLSPALLPSESCKINLSVEMETGVGKTYTYIKTMFELHERYGWNKYIIIVPRVAIREGVHKAMQTSEEHFAEIYHRKIRFFIYNSASPVDLEHFAKDSNINAMIITAQAFNARGEDARRIARKQESFNWRVPKEVLAATNPILIIDEPQSVEGEITRAKLQDFNPLITLRYSATHRENRVFNLVYRLDAQDAYNMGLVKKISVKGFRQSGMGGTGYVYLSGLDITDKAPRAYVEFNRKGRNGIKRQSRKCGEGANLFDLSNGLEEYRDNYIISRIDGRDNSIEFVNGLKLYSGEFLGNLEESDKRRLQIRETILSHLEREERNFRQGVPIKTLSLFFIDEVAKYRVYDKDSESSGEYARIFEEEYKKILEERKALLETNGEYEKWLALQKPEKSHAGYFSRDRKSGRLKNSKEKRDGGSDDVDAYDLIMKNREKLLDMNNPVRFIFSHSALSEGWDNPNVFQICALKDSDNKVRKRQEVGRGMRLCVNATGERMDAESVGQEQSERLNELTIIASESYDDFCRALQNEIADSVWDRPRLVQPQLFKDKKVQAEDGRTIKISEELAVAIHENLVGNQYVKGGTFTAKYWQDRKNGALALAEEAEPYRESVLKILDSVYDPDKLRPDDARGNNVTAMLNRKKLATEAFKKLWAQINSHSYYTVSFNEQQLVENCVRALNQKLHVNKVSFTLESGKMRRIESRKSLLDGAAFEMEAQQERQVEQPKNSLKYDLLGKIVEATGLTRQTAADILKGVMPDVFAKFRDNPEEFILNAAKLINDEKADVIVKKITYNKLDSSYGEDLFTSPGMRGQLGKNALAAKKHLYDHVIYQSDVERQFAEKLDLPGNDVEIYVKLPGKFTISTPMGPYNPDWAIAFHEGNVKHIYFVAETKGSLSSLELRGAEKGKIECARAHFQAISGANVKYDVVNSFDDLLNKVLK